MASPNSMAPAILATAHWEKYFETKDNDYFKDTEVWAEVKSLYTELLKRFPNSQRRHNWFARAACLAEDFQTAREEISAIRDHWLQPAWDSREKFEHCKTLAFQKNNGPTKTD